MHTYATSRFFVALFLLSWMTACTTIGSTTIKHPKTQPIPAGKSAVLTVEPSVASSEPIYYVVSARLRSALMNRLVSEQIFRTIVDTSGTADYHMDVKVVNIRKVSLKSRGLFGMYAGTDSINISVEVRESVTNLVVTAFQVSGRGAVWKSAQSAALQKIIDEVISALR